MTTVVLSCLLAFAASLAVERIAARAPAPRPSWAALPVRFCVFALLYAGWLAVWWRPWLAAFAAVTTLAVLTAISVRKRQLIGEPLIFSDFGLLRLAVRHPDLYYTGFMAEPPFLAALALFVASVATWLWLEPAVVGWAGALSLALAIAAGVTGGWIAAGRPALATALRRRLPAPALERDLARWGLLTTLVGYALRWQGAIHEPFPAEREASSGASPPPPDLVVVVQLESFVDPWRLGLAEAALPGFAALRARAVQHGALRVPSHGAFTMRSEYAVLTGLSQASAGFRSFDPYLTERGPAPATLASRLRARGYLTLFLHPFRPDFFGRSGLIPRFGFERALFEDDFAGAERFGPYVSDAAMVARILDEVHAMAPRRGLVVAVTMENHGPWQRERLPDEPDPTRQYLAHVANADAAATALVAGLDRHPGRVLVCLYGDHPPILPGLAVCDPPLTDYAILRVGRPEAEPLEPLERPLTADELGRLLSDLADATGGAPPGSGPA